METVVKNCFGQQPSNPPSCPAETQPVLCIFAATVFATSRNASLLADSCPNYITKGCRQLRTLLVFSGSQTSTADHLSLLRNEDAAVPQLVTANI
ncbi:unnamed protein product [Soboliphyme baturini]|uniref:Secreted protein n=1 Tax=Soboliphyme baturini TaxID=241478 RepID=A0A183IN28_9BILA|nr:unnamed protein product [Soboliphyme baturini]